MAERAIRAVLAENICHYADKRGIPLKTLAGLAGVSSAQLYSVIAEEKSATVDWLAKLAKELNVPTWKLLVPMADKDSP